MIRDTNRNGKTRGQGKDYYIKQAIRDINKKGKKRTRERI